MLYFRSLTSPRVFALLFGVFVAVLLLSCPSTLRAQDDVESVRITYDLIMKGSPAARRLVLAPATQLHVVSRDIQGVYWKRHREAYGSSLSAAQIEVLDAHIAALEGAGEFFGIGPRGSFEDGDSGVAMQQFVATKPQPSFPAEMKRLAVDAKKAFGARATQLFTLSGITSAPYLSESLVTVLADLSSNDAERRGRAAVRAGQERRDDALVLAALTSCLTKDPESPVRQVAAWALAAIGGPKAVAALTGALQAGANDRAIPAALARHPDRRAVPALLKALGSSDKDTVGNAVGALGSIGDIRARAPLSRLLKDETVFTLVTFGDVGIDTATGKVRVPMTYTGVRIGDAAGAAVSKLGTSKSE